MPTYRVRPGFRHGAGKVYGPGDVIELTEAEAAGFLDKLEPVAPAPLPEPVIVNQPPPSLPALRPKKGKS